MPARKKGSAELGLDVGSKAAKVATYLLIGRVITFLFTGVALVLVTRWLGPYQYGIYTLAIAFAGIFSTLGYFGIGTALNKFIAQYKQLNDNKQISAIISNGLFLIVISALILLLICFAFSGYVSVYLYHTVAMSYIINLIAFYLVFVLLFGVFYDALLGFGQGKYLAFMIIIESVFQALGSITLSFFMPMATAPIIGLILGYFVGFVVGIYFLFKYNKIRIIGPSFKYIKMIVSSVV